MTDQQQPSKTLHIALWIAQVVLAATLIWAAAMKLFQPIAKLAAMWPWAGEVSAELVRFTGIIDLLGGLGLVLPALLHKRSLTSITAIAIILLMLCTSVFHIARGEASLTGVNLFIALFAAFIAWGRWKKAPAVFER